MESRALIDAIVRQTTVLIAQISTAAGLRAPLAHIADQVFVNLAQELEQQGVGRKVIADMFGLALRSYQKKVHRLTTSATLPNKTLWEAMLDYLGEKGSVSRKELFERFKYDDEPIVGAVLNDLVQSGLAYSTGRGDNSMFGVTSEADRSAMHKESNYPGVMSLIWMSIYQQPGTLEEIAERSGFNEEVTARALNDLVTEGRAEEADGRYRAARVEIPVGAAKGWEAAVFDHYRAVATAVAAKLHNRRSEINDKIGGQTAGFDLHPRHPHREEVLNLLAETRERVTELWKRVSEHNQQHPIAEEEKTKVYFYFGQNVLSASEDEESLFSVTESHSPELPKTK